MTEIHIVFGSYSMAQAYSQVMAVNPNKIRLATHPETLMGLRISKVFVARYSKEAWQPPTDPCKKRVQETEQKLKELIKLGVEVVDRHFG